MWADASGELRWVWKARREAVANGGRCLKRLKSNNGTIVWKEDADFVVLEIDKVNGRGGDDFARLVDTKVMVF